MSRTCADCKYMYSNETMGDMYICVNGHSEMLGQFVGLCDHSQCADCENGEDEEVEE